MHVCNSINAHKTLLEKLLKRKKSLVVSYKKEAPRSFFVPYREKVPAPDLLPIDPTHDPLATSLLSTDDVAISGVETPLEERTQDDGSCNTCKGTQSSHVPRRLL